MHFSLQNPEINIADTYERRHEFLCNTEELEPLYDERIGAIFTAEKQFVLLFYHDSAQFQGWIKADNR